MSTETVGLLGSWAQDVHLDFHTAPIYLYEHLSNPISWDMPQVFHNGNNVPLLSASKQAHCALAVCNSECMIVALHGTFFLISTVVVYLQSRDPRHVQTKNKVVPTQQLHPSHLHNQPHFITMRIHYSSLQFKMVSMHSEKPICTPPRLSEVSPMSPLKWFQCSSDWRWWSDA